MASASAATRIPLVIADEHRLLVEGLRLILRTQPDLALIATATDAQHLLAVVERFRPAVAIVGQGMAYRDGSACLRRLREWDGSLIKILLLDDANPALLEQARKAGCEAACFKSDSPEHLLAMLRNLVASQAAFSPDVDPVGKRHASKNGMGFLTGRGLAVLAAARGLSHPAVAVFLQVSENTVKFHMQNIFCKLQTNNRTQATAVFLRQGGAALF